MTEGDTLENESQEAVERDVPLAEASKSVDELIAATGGGANAIFDFRHRVFSLPGARFAIDRRAKATMFYIYLGNLTVSLTPAVLRREFNIEPSSQDSHLIELAAQALRHVNEIRPGDSIPKELIDGTASWSVEERHRLIAKAKLLAQVASWFARDKAAASVENILAAMETDLVAKEEFQNAFAAIAKSLGLDAARKQEIIDHIDAIARELCYIEALRDHASQLRKIQEQATQLAKMSKGDPALNEELARVLVLLKPPVQEFAGRFTQVDAQTSELIAMLRDPHHQIDLIRSARDEIHSHLLAWDDIFERWRDRPAVLNHDTDENVHTLYHWLAANYAPSRVWR